MMNHFKKIAIIGAGNMGSAIAASLTDSPACMVLTAASQRTLQHAGELCPGAVCTTSNVEAVTDADLIFLCVKPFIAPEVFEEIRHHIMPGATVVSVIAGMSLSHLAEQLDSASKNLRILRAIPNTAIRLGKSATFIASAPEVDQATLDAVTDIFNRSGKAFVIKEKDMAACTALASCGIAYFLRFIRAAVEGSVELGLRPGFATEVAAITAEGAAALLHDGGHPEAEIDKVTTPGGLTIRGLNTLDEKGLNAAVIAALKASVS